MLFPARLFSLIVLTTAPALIARAGGEPYTLTQPTGVVGLATDCTASNGCAIHIEASVTGRIVRSAALPYRALSGETEASSTNDWNVGREEKSVSVSVSEAGNGGLLVRQEAGFDHPKTSYSLLMPDASGLRTIETWRTGNGPGSLRVESVNGKIKVERTQPGNVTMIENLRLDSTGKTLIPIQ